MQAGNAVCKQADKGEDMKAVIVDLDRTLLRTDKSISEYTARILWKCHGSGVRLIAATARPMRAIRCYDELIGFDATVALNGATVLTPQGSLDFGISRESGERILAAILRYPDVFLSIETSKGLYANREFPLWNPIVYDAFPILPEDAVLYKIIASSGKSPLYDNVESVLSNDTYHTIADQRLVQIMSRLATKWSGIKQVLNGFGILPKEAVYFGDDNDDIEPIKNCGLGVAVSNAIPSVLAAADRITASNDMDGVARFIEQNVLQGRE